MDISPTKQQIRQLRRDNAQWPLTLKDVPKEAWPAGSGLTPNGNVRTRVLRSRDFLVQEFFETNGIIRLSICRTDWDANAGRFRQGIGWDELQRLKREAGYGDRDAVEVFPADADIVNVANMRHLFVMPAKLPFAWRVASPADAR